MRDAALLGDIDIATIAAATFYEANGKAGDMSAAIRPLFDQARLIGPAFTVKSLPNDLSAMRRAVDVAPPGYVLVIDAGEDGVPIWGGSGTIAARRRGLAGVVTNGIVRDSAQIRELGFPVFCSGAGLRGGLRQHPGWHNVAVTVGGVLVHPGDLVVADADGVVVIAKDRIDAVTKLAKEKAKKEAAREMRLHQGEAYDI
ncbi:RraA family protein [Pigmentiphaga soli]|uniref:Putative 4-hydroxy-4-methyl-2-oxoglutarate aldolase n=1 Tax=Pigmentiphaga soli TaxID=1007095 RepID=A0ABP8HJQ4_9BURK